MSFSINHPRQAIQEDKSSKDSILGLGAYRSSPAYKYISLIDDRSNYLYEVVSELRRALGNYAIEFAASVPYSFTMADIDRKLLQNSNLEQIKYLFVYSLESIRKYLVQMPLLPQNDFYRMRNAFHIFSLCLVADKILGSKYEGSFRSHVPRRDMTMRDAVVLLFEDKGWINPLTQAQRRDPRRHMSMAPPLPKDPKDLIEKLFLNPVPFSCNGRTVNSEMKFVLLANALRNISAHQIKVHDVFVSEYEEITKWLMCSIFVAVSSL